MRIYVDLDLRQIVSSLGVKQPTAGLFFTRGDAVDLEVQFTRDGIVVDPGCESVFFCIKAPNDFDGTPLVLHTDFTKTGSGATALWTGQPNFNNGVLDTALGVGAGADISLLLTNAELGFVVGGRQTTTRLVRCTIENDLYRGGESPPASYPTAGIISFYPAITALTGGASNALDSLATVPVAIGALVQVIVSGELQTWQLQAGTTAESVPGGIVRPDDYNASTNAKIWVRLA